MRWTHEWHRRAAIAIVVIVVEGYFRWVAGAQQAQHGEHAEHADCDLHQQERHQCRPGSGLAKREHQHPRADQQREPRGHLAQPPVACEHDADARRHRGEREAEQHEGK
jgi:hypothetical protein